MADAEFQKFKKLLQQNNYFVTTPRMRLFGLLQKHPALTFKKLGQYENQHDLVTLYRNIDLFEKLGIVHKVRLGWQTHIELTDAFHVHHHHATCLKCGKTIDINEPLGMHKLVTELETQHGFKTSSHELEIQGICSTCQKTPTSIS
jgi:Fur family ferric uptake transcriptional regulator